jgi:purine-binding chemotaxis protein CheW
VKNTGSTVGVSDETRQLIEFRVGAEHFGVDLVRVKEIIRSREMTRLPRAPRFVKGVINLRGDLVPIVDLRDKLGLEAAADSDATRVIVVDVGGSLVGMVVDGADHVVRFPTDRIGPPPAIVGDAATEYIEGVGKLDDRLVILVNIDRILSAEERGELDAVTAA